MFNPAQLIKMLLVSHEPALRDSYSFVFQTAGYVVHAVPVEALPITIKATSFDVLVMDHTLSEQERKAGVYIAHQLVPKLSTVVLHASGGDCGADLTIDSREGIEVIPWSIQKLVRGEQK